MIQRNFITLLLILTFIILVWAGNPAQAGFGIAPPSIDNPNLLRGSHYEKEIFLLRGESNEDIQATVTVYAPDFPEILDWISIDKGSSFILPKGINQFPIVVSIDVPKKAKYKDYKGYIDVRSEANQNEKDAGVAILLGARIQIALSVSDKPVPDFKVNAVDILTVAECCSLKYSMVIENTGNVEARPTKVQLRVYHGYEKERLLHVTEVDDEDLAWVKTNKTKEIIATFPLKLKPGRYWGEAHVFRGSQILRTDKMYFTVTPGRTIFGITICGCNIGWLILRLIIFLGIVYLIFKWLSKFKITKK